MTLFKLLLLGAAVAFLMVFVATEAIYIRNAHRYMQEQLADQAQNAASALGMVLPMADGDSVHAEVTVNALFDRGYYQSIRIVGIDGTTVVLKTLPEAPVDVPEWFVNMLPLQAPSAESLISKGWRQQGRVIVIAHPNFAYLQLWRTMQQTSLSLALVFLLVLAALFQFLTRILKPLRAIESVAHSISNRDFQSIKAIPKTRELGNVVNAINSMSDKLQGIVAYEVAQAKHFRDESTRDPLTGLVNRRGFEAYVGTFIGGGKDLDSGAMFMLQIAEFQVLNARYGYEKVDALLQDISAALQSVWPDRDLLRARINGATFSVVAANISRAEAMQLGDDLVDALGKTVEKLQGDSNVVIGGGAVYFSGQSFTLKAMLAQCDAAMLQSLANRNRQCVFQSLADDGQGQGSQYWKKLIIDAIEQQRISLFSQPVLNMRDQSEFQTEIIGRLKRDDGGLILAEQFIPMANRHRLTASFDLAVLKKLFGRIASGMIGDDEIAINISVYSIHDRELQDWLQNAMQASPRLAQRLIFEFTEFGLVQDRSGVEKFLKEIRAHGADFAVDNFGLHHSAFDYLQQLKPRYVKLSPAYLYEIRENQKNQFFISSVVKITRPLEVRVIALGVEDIETLELLRDLGVDAYQGFITGSMTELG
ncbi:MAG: EAL domain-containing protein [Gallionella sp.]